MTLSLPLIFGTFLSALVSGTTGVAGGAILMAFLTLSLAPVEAIAVHGFLQIFSNLSRILFFYRFVELKAFFLFLVFVVPGVYLGTHALKLADPDMVKRALGLMIALSAFKIGHSQNESSWGRWVFVPIGFLSGFVGSLAGVVGPILAPLFIRAGLTKEYMIATKALCQMSVQIVKVLFFTMILNFSYSSFGWTALVLVALLFLGTFVAKLILKKISLGYFELLLKVTLVLTGLRLLVL